MTTAKKSKIHSPFRLPDPPEREPEDMTNAKHLAETGNMHHLKLHLGNPETTIAKSELYLALDRRGSGAPFRIPDLLIAFDADPELYERNNGYVVSEQGKPPDFVLEIASPGTRMEDNTVKRDFYARHGVVEYWRFDEEDGPNRIRLAGDRLVDGAYQPIPIDTLPDGRLRGSSAVLNLILEWHDGNLNWIDPDTEEHIPTFQQERDGRLQAETRESQERQARLQAETRNRELEAELRRLRGE